MRSYFIHQPLHAEITSISGHYLIAKEARIPFDSRDILYVTGCAVADTSCCGAGGCAFANVPGYILSWKEKIDSNGLFISEVEHVTDIKIQNQIREIIRIKEGITQINFYE
ncbi:MAG: hypothetical protein EHM85_08045 [Desulfobacteraceae bacterium]|nr:MAG: hypothetical protein EHM85_08045 [Desulfobacteraceae bacterium]